MMRFYRILVYATVSIAIIAGISCTPSANTGDKLESESLKGNRTVRINTPGPGQWAAVIT